MKLRAKLLLVFVPIIAGALLTLGVTVYQQLRASSEEDLHRQMGVLLVQSQERLSASLDTLRANARLFATSHLIKRYLREEDEADRYALMQPALLDLFEQYQQAYPAYREIRLLLPDGYEDTRLADTALFNASEEEAGSIWFARMQKARGYYNTVMRSPDDNRMVQLVSHPVMMIDRDVSPALASPKLRGYLVITAELDELADQVRQRSIGLSGFLEVHERDGTVLFSKLADHVGARLDGFDGECGEASFQGRRQSEGIPAFVQCRPLGEDLVLVAVLPDTEFVADRQRLASTVALITLAAIAIAIAVAFLLLRRLVLNPLYLLGRQARRIGDGKDVPGFASGIARNDEIGDLFRAFRDMSVKLGVTVGELRNSHARIEELAFTDSLTTLPNRRRFLDLALEACEQSVTNGSRCALLFLDLNDFKRVNDLLGHDVGDELLQVAGQRLSCLLDERTAARLSNKATSGLVARLGGDEFTMLLPDLHDDTEAMSMARDIVASLGRPVTLRDREVVAGASVGVAIYPDDASTLSGLMKHADAAMYAAKSGDGDRWQRFDESLQESLERVVTLENDLQLALEGDQIGICYQPQICIRDGSIRGVEALLRWRHPEFGLVSPEEFIPIAERTGLIGSLGLHVLNEACAQWARWHAQGFDTLRLSLNVSPREFGLRDVQHDIEAARERWNIPAGLLELELTEGCMVEAPADVVVILERMRSTGVRVALDDFGTGYSSLSMLLSLPIDTLKIDESLISGLKAGCHSGHVVDAILNLARGLGLEVVAEGVETDDELTFLAGAGCDLAQGFLLEVPLSAEDLTRRLLQETASRRQSA